MELSYLFRFISLKGSLRAFTTVYISIQVLGLAGCNNSPQCLPNTAEIEVREGKNGEDIGSGDEIFNRSDNWEITNKDIKDIAERKLKEHKLLLNLDYSSIRYKAIEKNGEKRGEITLSIYGSKQEIVLEVDINNTNNVEFSDKTKKQLNTIAANIIEQNIACIPETMKQFFNVIAIENKPNEIYFEFQHDSYTSRIRLNTVGVIKRSPSEIFTFIRPIESRIQQNNTLVNIFKVSKLDPDIELSILETGTIIYVDNAGEEYKIDEGDVSVILSDVSLTLINSTDEFFREQNIIDFNNSLLELGEAYNEYRIDDSNNL